MSLTRFQQLKLDEVVNEIETIGEAARGYNETFCGVPPGAVDLLSHEEKLYVEGELSKRGIRLDIKDMVIHLD